MHICITECFKKNFILKFYILKEHLPGTIATSFILRLQIYILILKMLLFFPCCYNVCVAKKFCIKRFYKVLWKDRKSINNQFCLNSIYPSIPLILGLRGLELLGLWRIRESQRRGNSAKSLWRSKQQKS